MSSPEIEDDLPFVPKRRRRRKVGRPPKRGLRLSPSQRLGRRYKTVTIYEETYFMLVEMKAFYKKTMSRLTSEAVEPMFKRAMIESRALAIIEARKEENNAHDRTHDSD